MPPKNNTAEKNKGINQFQKNKLEWTVFAISSLLLLFILVYLCYQTFAHKPSPPDLEVSYSKESSARNPFGYKIILENHGEETAEDVIIQASLLKNNTAIEQSELQIVFSPKRSKREGWINFTSNPAEADSIQVKVVSYKKP